MRRYIASLAFVVTLVALVLGGGGCEFIVSGDVPAFTCRGSAPGVCPSGSYCAGAGCAPCEKNDICDGFDNDCNGKVDDGPGSDHDGDGYTVCGRLDPDGGTLLDRDCDDNDKDVHPGAKEVCNGKDDDCDGLVDNGSCPDGTTCAPKTGECISSTTACDPQTKPCPPPSICDPGTRQCITKNSAKIGEECKSDDECESGTFCGYASALTSAVVKTSAGVCTKGCCQSTDCPTDFVCYTYANGGNYCIGKAVLGRTTLGVGRGGESCTDGTTCRSGVCTPNGKCEDVCCADANCKAPAVCRATSIGAHTALGCADPNGSVGPAGYCGGSSRCARGVCADDDNTCYNTCCGSSGCGTIDLGISGVYPLVCDDVPPLGHAADVAPACGSAVSAGAKQLGEACTDDRDCRSYRCYADATSGAKSCSDVCCTDADCARAGMVCRPRDLGQGRFFLRCTKS